MNIKSLLRKHIGKKSTRLALSLAYLHNRGRWPQLKNPKDLSEILIANILAGYPQQHYELADKYRVRDYVAQRGYAHLLTPLLGVWNNANEINFDTLPNRFALKMNYGAGMNIICTDKSKLPPPITQLNNWLTIDYDSYSEPHYSLIDRKIIAEEFIDDGTGGFPADYKFMCMNGHVSCVLACYGRETGHATYAPFSLQWEYLSQYDKRKHPGDISIDRPANLQEMIKVAEDLSRGLKFARIDLYSSGSRIWFGEITLTPSGAILHGWTQKAINELGKFYHKFNPPPSR